jgi:hypothetical protein
MKLASFLERDNRHIPPTLSSPTSLFVARRFVSILYRPIPEKIPLIQDKANVTLRRRHRFGRLIGIVSLSRQAFG